MKQETYIKISEFVRKYPHGESIVKYANNIITGVVYMAYFVILIFLAVNRDERVIRIVLVTGYLLYWLVFSGMLWTHQDLIHFV